MNHYGTWADTQAWDADVLLSSSTISRAVKEMIPPRRAERFFDYAFLSLPLWNRFITAARTYSDASFIVNFCTRGKSRRCQRLSCSVRRFSSSATLNDLHSCRSSRLQTFFENFHWCTNVHYSVKSPLISSCHI